MTVTRRRESDDEVASAVLRESVVVFSENRRSPLSLLHAFEVDRQGLGQ